MIDMTILPRRLTITGLALSMSACAVTAPALSTAERQAADETVRETIALYQGCMAGMVDDYVTVDTATASEIAAAADAGCAELYRDYERALVRYFTGVVSPSGQQAARDRALAHAAEARRNAQGMAIMRVLEHRRP